METNSVHLSVIISDIIVVWIWSRSIRYTWIWGCVLNGPQNYISLYLIAGNPFYERGRYWVEVGP